MTEAIRWLRDWSTEVSPIWLTPSSESVECWLRWMNQYQLGRKRILDTQYAALLHVHGVRRLLTNNPDDFRVFNVLEMVTI